MMDLMNFQGINVQGKSCRGFSLICNLDEEYILCKEIHQPSDESIIGPLIEFRTDHLFGEQFLNNLHPYKNNISIIEQLFVYVTEDVYSSKNYSRQQMIEFIAFFLEQSRLLIYKLDNKKPLYGDDKYETSDTTLSSVILSEGEKLFNINDSDNESESVTEESNFDNSSAIVDSTSTDAEAEKSAVPGLDSIVSSIVLTATILSLVTILEKKQKKLKAWDKNTERSFKQWFGTTDKKSVSIISTRIDKALAFSKKLTTDNFAESEIDGPGLYAYVYREDESTIYLGDEFTHAPDDGYDSKAGTIVHEISHFNSVSGTDDLAYGQIDCLNLAKDDSDSALNNADSFMYFIEGK